jgi:hypothetical protein
MIIFEGHPPRKRSFLGRCTKPEEKTQQDRCRFAATTRRKQGFQLGYGAAK